jgi:hypothetical protein
VAVCRVILAQSVRHSLAYITAAIHDGSVYLIRHSFASELAAESSGLLVPRLCLGTQCGEALPHESCVRQCQTNWHLRQSLAGSAFPGGSLGTRVKPGRPKKKAADRKTVDLWIPVTARQKELIYAALAGDEFARWAREVLLRSAAELRGGKEEDGG